MNERMRFVARHQAGEEVSELCREFGISRKTGHKIISRFEEHGVAALADQSRRPKRIARRTRPELEELMVATRNEHPRWGGKKLKVMPERQHPGVRFRSQTPRRMARHLR